MTVGSISSNNYIQKVASSNAQQLSAASARLSGASVQSAFTSLAHALQSGDLSGAQQAYATIKKTWSAFNSGTATTTSGGTIQTAFNNLGQALQTGDLQGAQQAFNTLQHTVATRGGHHHHHHHGGGVNPNSGTVNGTGTGIAGTNSVTNPNSLFSALLQQQSGGVAGLGSNQSTVNVVV